MSKGRKEETRHVIARVKLGAADDRAKALRSSPFGNLIVEDAAASREHGRATARVGVDAAGNPVVYSTRTATREAIVESIKNRTNVSYSDIPEVTAIQFEKLMSEGGRALELERAHEPQRLEKGHSGAPAKGFTLRVTDGREGDEVVSKGPFARITDAMDAMQNIGRSGQFAIIYGRSGIADYRGGRAIFKFGRTQWSRAV